MRERSAGGFCSAGQAASASPFIFCTHPKPPCRRFVVLLSRLRGLPSIVGFGMRDMTLEVSKEAKQADTDRKQLAHAASFPTP